MSIVEDEWPEDTGALPAREILSRLKGQVETGQQPTGVIAGKTLKEISEIRPQFNVTFSHEFGGDGASVLDVSKKLPMSAD